MAVTVLAALLMSYRQLSDFRKSRHIAIANDLFEELNALESIEARRWVYRHLDAEPEKLVETLTDEERAIVKRVLNSLDRVAFLTQSGWIPEAVVMPWMNPMIVKSWTKLRPLIEFESCRRNEPDYYEHVTRLGERCVEWCKTHYNNYDLRWLEDAL